VRPGDHGLSIDHGFIPPQRPALSPLRTKRTMANWLQDVANLIAVATAAVPWHVFVFVAVAIYIAWRVWPRVYGVFHLGTQLERLLDGQRMLVHEVLPASYLRLTPIHRARAERAIQRCVLLCNISDSSSFSLYPVSPSTSSIIKLDTLRFLLLAGSNILLKRSACS
jgi:hypothetical protein